MEKSKSSVLRRHPTARMSRYLSVCWAYCFTSMQVGDLLHDVPSLAGTGDHLRFSVVTSSVQGRPPQFKVGERNGLLVTSSQIDREAACPRGGDVTDCVIRLDVAVRPLAVFRLVAVDVTVVDINDNSPEFPTTRYQVPMVKKTCATTLTKNPKVILEETASPVGGALSRSLFFRHSRNGPFSWKIWTLI